VSYPAGRAWYREHGVEEPSLGAAPPNGTKSTSLEMPTKGTSS
jgi:hypothetical protein